MFLSSVHSDQAIGFVTPIGEIVLFDASSPLRSSSRGWHSFLSTRHVSHRSLDGLFFPSPTSHSTPLLALASNHLVVFHVCMVFVPWFLSPRDPIVSMKHPRRQVDETTRSRCRVYLEQDRRAGNAVVNRGEGSGHDRAKKGCICTHAKVHLFRGHGPPVARLCFDGATSHARPMLSYVEEWIERRHS